MFVTCNKQVSSLVSECRAEAVHEAHVVPFTMDTATHLGMRPEGRRFVSPLKTRAPSVSVPSSPKAGSPKSKLAETAVSVPAASSSSSKLQTTANANATAPQNSSVTTATPLFQSGFEDRVVVYPDIVHHLVEPKRQPDAGPNDGE